MNRTILSTVFGLITCLAALATDANAGWSIGKLTYLNAYTLGSRAVATAIIASDLHAPPCGNTGYMLYIDTAAGRAQYAMLLSAWQAGTVVGIAGTNACTIQPNAEDVSHVDVAAGR